MKKLVPYSGPKLMKMKVKGNQIVNEKYKLPQGRGKVDRDRIKDFVQSKSESLNEANFNGQISVALHYVGIGWRSGGFTSVGEPITMYNHDAYEEEDEPESNDVDAFQVYYMKNAVAAGGCDNKQNDCLWECLTTALGPHQKMKSPSQLKTFLKLKRNDLVPISCMQTIENNLNLFRINVSGDHTYTSTKQCPRTINLKLLDGHYTLQAAKIRVPGVAYKEKIPLMYTLDNAAYTVFDPKNGERVITKQQFKEMKAKPVSSLYTLIPTDPKSKESMPIQYAAFLCDAKTLKVESKGLINLFKTGTHVKAALSLFNHFNKTVTSEPIRQVESEWINKASFAALIYADKYTGPLYKYDVCSHYPALMSSHLMKFPLREGTYHSITDTDFAQHERIPYGIYRCSVSPNTTSYKLFRPNSQNYYTHIDLTIARDMKLAIVMIQDKQPNQLTYAQTDLVTGHQLFKEYCDFLFDLKDRKVIFAKKILNVLWGALCQKNIVKMVVSDDDDTEILGDKTITKIFPKSETETQVEFYKNDSLYETAWGRIAPFILARGRQQIGKWISNDVDSVVRLHSDGFVCTKPLTDVKLGTKMGDLKYEGHCANATVHNNIKVEGKFFI